MVQYRVIVNELCFSGVQGAPCPIGTFRGKAARQRALDAARAEAGDRVSVTSVEVVQIGGARDGAVVERIANPGAYMPAGYPYCAGIYVDPRTRDIVAVHAVSRDSRVPNAPPPAYTFEVLQPGVVLPDPKATRESVLATLGVREAS